MVRYPSGSATVALRRAEGSERAVYVLAGTMPEKTAGTHLKPSTIRHARTKTFWPATGAPYSATYWAVMSAAPWRGKAKVQLLGKSGSGGNPKAEGRIPKETRRPKSEGRSESE